MCMKTISYFGIERKRIDFDHKSEQMNKSERNDAVEHISKGEDDNALVKGKYFLFFLNLSMIKMTKSGYKIKLKTMTVELIYL